MMVPSSDGTPISVHDLGGTGSALLVSHATGFHGRCYLPLAHRLAGRHSIAFDYRGHGDTPWPGGEVDWQRYGDDAVAMAAWLADREGGPIDAFGHSMGGACLLMAAHRRPELFRRLVLFEPIVFPPETRGDGHDNPLAKGALRRRATFSNYADAIANFSEKPPMRSFHPEAVDAYVLYGFREGSDGKVHLKCAREIESGTFATGSAHDTWDHLPSIATEVVVVCGRVEAMSASMVAEPVASRLPRCKFVQRHDLDHFGPMTHPAEMAELLTELLAVSIR
ncbi:MAG TPA: alpha/beta hydrolase [Ilumatobacteraceae bacterium]|nr:alpha/beta hydrolase [Ilumatobacteraceae bacterium]